MWRRIRGWRSGLTMMLKLKHRVCGLASHLPGTRHWQRLCFSRLVSICPHLCRSGHTSASPSAQEASLSTTPYMGEIFQLTYPILRVHHHLMVTPGHRSPLQVSKMAQAGRRNQAQQRIWA